MEKLHFAHTRLWARLALAWPWLLGKLSNWPARQPPQSSSAQGLRCLGQWGPWVPWGTNYCIFMFGYMMMLSSRSMLRLPYDYIIRL